MGDPRASTTSPRTSAAATRPTTAPPAATPWPDAWRACSRRTPCSVPQLITDWRSGLDTDGAGGDLDPDLRWQAELWRRLLGRVGAPPPDVRLADTMERLRAGGDDLDLPPRLSLFGHTRLPGDRGGAAASAGRAARGPPLAAAGLARPVGRAGSRPPAPARCRARRRRLVQRWSAIRCSARWGATRASCGARSASSPVPPSRRPPVAARHAARLAPARPTCQRRARRRDPVRAARPATTSVQVHACHGCGPSGRRAPRGAGRPAAGRPDARAARHPRDVPRHRVLRTADLGRLRARRRRRSREPATRPTSCGCGSPTARSAPPTRCSASPRSSSSWCVGG